MDLVFLREVDSQGNIYKYDDLKNRMNNQIGELYFADRETDEIYKFWLSPRVDNSSGPLWWYMKSKSNDASPWLLADDLGKHVMDCLISDRRPFK